MLLYQNKGYLYRIRVKTYLKKSSFIFYLFVTVLKKKKWVKHQLKLRRYFVSIKLQKGSSRIFVLCLPILPKYEWKVVTHLNVSWVFFKQKFNSHHRIVTNIAFYPILFYLQNIKEIRDELLLSNFTLVLCFLFEQE